jgi:hypothetical protein
MVKLFKQNILSALVLFNTETPTLWLHAHIFTLLEVYIHFTLGYGNYSEASDILLWAVQASTEIKPQTMYS